MRDIGGVNVGEYVYPDPGARVCEGIYIGSLSTATSQRVLDLHNIDVIVNLSGTKYVSKCAVYNIIMDDVPVTPKTMDSYIEKFGQGVDIIAKNHSAGKRVLIHCAAGINRSATLIAFYLIQHGWTYQSAYMALHAANQSRGVALLTNDSFRYLLQARDSFRRNFTKK